MPDDSGVTVATDGRAGCVGFGRVADGGGVAVTAGGGTVGVEFCRVAESVINGLVTFDLQPTVINRIVTRIANVLNRFI